MRSNIITLHYQDNASPQERAYVSALCGGISGGVVTRVMGMSPRHRIMIDWYSNSL